MCQLGETPLTNKLGLKLTPEGSKELARFDCHDSDGERVWTGGSVIAALKSNAMLSEQPLTYSVGRGGHFEHHLQLPRSFVGETPNPLVEEAGCCDPEHIVWKMNPKLVNEEKIEANSIL